MMKNNIELSYCLVYLSFISVARFSGMRESVESDGAFGSSWIIQKYPTLVFPSFTLSRPRSSS